MTVMSVQFVESLSETPFITNVSKLSIVKLLFSVSTLGYSFHSVHLAAND